MQRPGTSRLALAAALALTASVGCARCAGRGAVAADPAELLPAGAPVAVVAPTLAEAAKQLSSLYRTLETIPGGGDLREAFIAVKAQLGFDPLTAQGLADAGFDPGRGAAAGVAWGGPPLVVLPVKDAARFDALCLRLARDRMGAAHRATRALSGHEVVSYQTGPGAPPALSYTLVRGFAVLAPGAGGAAAVAQAASQSLEASLARSPAFAQAKRALGGGWAAIGFAPPGSPALTGAPFARDGAAAGLRAGAAGIGLRAALLLGPDRAPGWQALAGPAAAEGGRASLDLVAHLDPEAFLAARYGGDPAALGPRLVPALPAFAKDALAAAQLDAQKDFFDLLAPGVALTVSVAPAMQLGRLAGSLDPRTTNPFTLVRLEAAGRVKDPARARAVLDRVAQAAPRYGATVKSRPLEKGGVAWTASYRLGEGLTWALEGDRIVAAGGPGAFDAVEKRLATAAAGYAVPAEARDAFGKGLGAAVVDFQNLVKSVRALPESSYGSGPNAFVMRSLAGRFLDPMGRLRFALAQLDVREGAAVLDVEVTGMAPAAAP